MKRPVSFWESEGFLKGLVLILAVVFFYVPVWWSGFQWDDDIVLKSNPVIVGPKGFADIWTTTAADVCPLTLSTFWVMHALFGLEPLPYHLLNVALYAVSAILLWKLLERLGVAGAWWGAALWTLHPVQAESVAWVSELKNTQSGVFYLLSAWFFFGWARREEKDQGLTFYYIIAVLMAVCAMASKSSTVILPLMLVAGLWWLGKLNRRTVMSLAPFFLLSLVAGLVSIWTQGSQLVTEPDTNSPLSFPARLIAAGNAFWFYLGKLVWPYPLVLIYPRWAPDAASALAYLPLVLAVIFVGGLWWVRRFVGRGPIFAVSCFALALLPVMGFVQMFYFRYSFVADHLQYLASMAPLALVGAGLCALRNPVARNSIGVVLLVVLGALSFLRAIVFADSQGLWREAAYWNPDSASVHHNLGVSLETPGRNEAAIAEYHRTLELDPNYSRAAYNLGVLNQDNGDFQEAIYWYERDLKLNPNHVKAINNLGNVYAQMNRYDDAIREFEEGLKKNPGEVTIYNGLGVIYAQQKQYDKSLAEFREALRLQPDYTDARNNLQRVEQMANPAGGSVHP